jgi:phosphoglycolate phosphatase
LTNHKRPKFKACIFDFDGTVIDSFTVSYSLHLSLAQQLNLPEPNFEIFRKIWGRDWDEMLKILWPKDWQLAKRAFLTFFAGKKFPMIAGVNEVLLEMKARQIKLALISNRDHESLQWRLGQTNLPQGLFFFVQGVTNGLKPKPAIDMYEKALALAFQAGVKPYEIVCLGDSLVDLETARNLNLEFVAFCSGVTTSEEFAAAGVQAEFITLQPSQWPQII